MRELMRKKRAAERVRKEMEDGRVGEVSGVEGSPQPLPIIPTPVVNLGRTDRKFEEDRPGYYIFGNNVNERNCWMCGNRYETLMELNKFCGPKCKNEWLTTAFGKLKGVTE